MHRVIAAVVLAAASLAVSSDVGHRPADADEDGLGLTSTITYDVQTADVPVRVTWDVTVADNDPATQPDGSGSLVYYHTINLPVVRGASSARATDSAGRNLGVFVSDAGAGVAENAAVGLAEPLFYGETTSFRLTYTLPSARSEGILVTPNYAFLPVITAGDESTVVVNTPPGDPWQTTLEARECAGSGNTFTCSGAGDAYVAATVEVVQPAAIARATFPVELEAVTLQVELAYLVGEDAAAGRQRDLMIAALPLIEEMYGVPYDGPPTVRVSHGGRQSVLGYEGLASCVTDSCDIVISPVADDYTVLHEAAHLWSDLYARRWLAEGFAELTAHEVVSLLPEGVFTGAIPERRAQGTNLQLDDWGEAGSIIGAEASDVAIIEAGYDYSLRFLQQLRYTYGLDGLRAVNREIVATGPADSRRFMDLMESQSGEPLDAEFLLWVFPEDYRVILAQRREARDRLSALRATMVAEELPTTPLATIDQQVSAWQFGEALAAIEQLEANLDTYANLSNQYAALQRGAEAAGLTLSDDILDSLNRFDFNAAATLIESSRRALDLYIQAQALVGDDRSFWVQFGLLGTDPEEDLRDAEEAFQEGQYSEAARRAEHASELVSGASAKALERALIFAGFLALVALLIGLAVTYGRLRYRTLQP